MNNKLTWNFIEFIFTKDCIQGKTLDKRTIFLIFEDGEIIFTPNLNYDKWPDPVLNIFELKEINELAQLYIVDGHKKLLDKYNG